MVVGGREGFLVMTLYGEIDLKKIGKSSKIMKMQGLEHLRMLGEDNKVKVKYKDKDKNKDQ